MDEKLFDLMSKMYNEIQDLKGEMQEGFKEVRGEIQDIKKDIIRIEVEHGKKLDALFDGYKQNSEQLTRIEDEVKRHDEVILRRVN